MTVNRWLAIGGMVSVLFLPVVLLIGETRRGYSHVSEHISALSASGVTAAWAQTTNFVIFGLLLIALAVGLHRGINNSTGSVLGPALLVVVGLSAGIGSAIFPEEQVGDPETTIGILHAIASVVGFAALAAAMLFALPRRFQQDPRWANLAAPTRWLGVVAAVLFFSFPLGVEGIVEAFEPRGGLIQRLFAATVLVWLFMLSLRLFQTSKTPSASETNTR